MPDIICPGNCNKQYRRVMDAYQDAIAEWERDEQTHAEWRRTAGTHGTEAAGPEPARYERPDPPTINPWAGEPIWCRKCSASIRRCLTSLDELMSLRLTMTDGYEAPGQSLTDKIRKVSTEPASPSPGQDDLDELIDWLREWEQAYRESQGWGHIPYRGKAAPSLTSSVAWLLPRLDGILAHPDLAEGFGKGIFIQHSRLESMTRTRPPMRHKPLPCPRCRRRSLFLQDDGNVHCNNEDCRRVMSEREYKEYEDEADQQVAS